MQLMKKFEEENPFEMRDIERNIMELMEIEQADELQEVTFSVM